MSKQVRFRFELGIFSLFELLLKESFHFQFDLHFFRWPVGINEWKERTKKIHKPIHLKTLGV
jgi:hypothetical protein